MVVYRSLSLLFVMLHLVMMNGAADDGVATPAQTTAVDKDKELKIPNNNPSAISSSLISVRVGEKELMLSLNVSFVVSRIDIARETQRPNRIILLVGSYWRIYALLREVTQHCNSHKIAHGTSYGFPRGASVWFNEMQDLVGFTGNAAHCIIGYNFKQIPIRLDFRTFDWYDIETLNVDTCQVTNESAKYRRHLCPQTPANESFFLTESFQESSSHQRETKAVDRQPQQISSPNNLSCMNIVRLPLKHALVWYVDDFFTENEAKELLLALNQEVHLKKRDGEARLTALHGHTSSYEYARNGPVKPSPWTPTLLKIKSKIAEFYKLFLPVCCKNIPADEIHNVCLLNYTPNGRKDFPFHADKEEIGNAIPLASVSLGALRTFKFVAQATSNQEKETISLTLQNGSLLVMGPGCHEHYLHSLIKDPQIELSRLNLTFRHSCPPID